MSASSTNQRHAVLRGTTLAVCLVAAAAVAIRLFVGAPVAHAQGGPQGGPPGFGQGPGGFGGRPPFVMGQVVEVGKTQKMIAVSNPFGGEEQVINVSDATKIVTQTDAKIADVKVGDQIQINGMPTGIRAASLTIGEAPDMFRMMMPGGRGGQGGPGGQGGRNQQRTAFAMATGKVTAVSPLTVAIDSTVSAVIKLAPDARVQKVGPITLASIKDGDRIMAGGTFNSEGVLEATTVAVNVGGGMGMFGGPGGPRGPGGPGGGPGRPGGPGGAAPPQ
jgi:hypothetical protein